MRVKYFFLAFPPVLIPARRGSLMALKGSTHAFLLHLPLYMQADLTHWQVTHCVCVRACARIQGESKACVTPAKPTPGAMVFAA